MVQTFVMNTVSTHLTNTPRKVCLTVNSDFIWVVRSQVSYFLIFVYLYFLVFCRKCQLLWYEEKIIEA